MFSPSEKRFEERMRRKTIKRLEDPTAKEEARRACHLAAERIWKATSSSKFDGQPAIPSFDYSLDSSSVASVHSAYSSERAVRRGWRRGSSEMNEVGSVASASEFDLTTVTEADTDFTASPKKKKEPKQKPKKKKKSKGEEESGDAWMCGVCGKAFATIEAADRHEKDHIQQVVNDLGWAGDKNRNNNAFLQTPVNAPDVLRPIESAVPLEEEITPKASGTRELDKTKSQRNSRKEFFRSRMGDIEEEKMEEVDEPDTHKPAAEDFPDFGADVPVGTLVPKPRARANSEPLTTGFAKPRPRTHSEVRFDSSVDPLLGKEYQAEDALLLSKPMEDFVVLADEALVNVCEQAKPMILTKAELQAERELALLAKDKAYYQELAQRALDRQSNPSSRFRSEEESLLGKVQNKLVDAYQLMKESNGQIKGMTDQYNRKKKGKDDEVIEIVHTNKTLYVNVIVKNSIQVVKNELERLARERWEAEEMEVEKFTRFELFRFFAHTNAVRLAGIALASDFTPRRIAVQLSNDLYRLLTPRLKRRGVTIATEIEYRVGPYFVIAANINTIDWGKLIKATHRDLAIRKARWDEERKRDDDSDQEDEKKGVLRRWKEHLSRLFSMTKYDVLAQILAWMYYLHWTISLPICWISYHTFLGSTIRHFILSSVTDEIFYYVEEKGMEMEIQIRNAAKQAAFMLSALREIRADEEELKKKRQESEAQEKGAVLGPLLGPAIKADKGAAVEPPGFELPENLEYVGLELDLPVGFRRLRWAMLSNQCAFITEALYKTEAKYEDITVGDWDKYNDYIGAPSLPDSVDPQNFLGAEKVSSYLMPKSAFVKANMCTETAYIIAYNDYCFCVKKKALTPDVPYGSTFIAWTQLLIINTGNESCKLYCSVEPEFPNGPPLVSRQIKSGMRAGTAEFFVLFGETITKYADEYP